MPRSSGKKSNVTRLCQTLHRRLQQRVFQKSNGDDDRAKDKKDLALLIMIRNAESSGHSFHSTKCPKAPHRDHFALDLTAEDNCNALICL